MRILYADSAVGGFEGHHATSALALPVAFRNLGHEVIVAGHADVLPEMRRQTGALPVFRAQTYLGPSADPISAWLTNFLWARDMTLEDLTRFWSENGPFDLIYFNSARAAQVVALGLLLRQLSSGGVPIPRVVIELAIEAGLTQTGSGTYSVRDIGAATLFRHCREWLGDEVFGELIFVAGCRQAVEEYTAIFLAPVHLAPMPQPLPVTRLRKRAAGQPSSLTVGFVGHQRTDKGYHLLPALIRQILHGRANVRVLVQQSEPGTMRSISDEIARVAHYDNRVELILRPFPAQEWFALLDRCDIVALPYTQSRYETSASAVIGEALAAGAPVVVPARTTLSSVVDELGGPGTTFERWETASIASGIAEAIDRFDELAECAFEAGRNWRERHGPDHFARAVLGLASKRTGAPRRRSAPASLNRDDFRVVVE